MTAEAFASWFLMPRKAVLAAAVDLGLSGVTSPADAYQLSLLLGTTFRATCRQLANLRLLTPDNSRSWSRLPPARFKRDLATAVDLPLDSTLDVDVWDLRHSAPSRAEVSVGDLLLLPPPARLSTGSASFLRQRAASAKSVVYECTTENGQIQLEVATGVIKVIVHGRPDRLDVPDPHPGQEADPTHEGEVSA